MKKKKSKSRAPGANPGATATPKSNNHRHQKRNKNGTNEKSATTTGSKQGSNRVLEILVLCFIMPLIITLVAVTTIKDSHFFLRFLFCVALDSTYGTAIVTLLNPLSEKIARKLPGTMQQQGQQQPYLDNVSLKNDTTTIVWPPSDATIPAEWQRLATERQRKRRRQRQTQKDDDNNDDEPLWFLNHVRGSVRFRQAILRLAVAGGTLLMAYIMTHYIDPALPNDEYSSTLKTRTTTTTTMPPTTTERSLASIGLTISARDIGCGFVVGSGVILVLFAAEVALGWIHVLGYWETVVAEESWSLNILWDCLFHLGVSISEEVSTRGWILVHSMAYLSKAWNLPKTTSFAVATSVQASWFALAHRGSPGVNRIGLTNLVIGGTAAALNVLVSGSLSFNLGWHFGWNIWMGHLLGLSTSGIPMSAKLVSILPHPSKANLHGGRFGPEQSPLAPIAYALGLIALFAIYDTPVGLTSQ